MSVGEFSTALKNKAIKEWFLNEQASSGANRPDSQKDKRASQVEYTLENVNNLVNTSSEYRAKYQTSGTTSFIITRDTIASLLVDLKGMDPTSETFQESVDIAFSAFRQKDVGAKVNRKKITIGPGLPAVFFSEISFDTITNLVNNILNLKPGELAKKYEKGHVVGINTALLRETKDRIAAINTSGSTGKAKILEELDKVIDYYARLDFASANIQPAYDVAVYASASKILKKSGALKFLVELQPKSANQRSADEVKATIGGIRKLFTPGALASEAQMVKTIDKLISSVSDPKFVQDLMNLRSSPSTKDLIVNRFVDVLQGNTTKDITYNVPSVKISQVKPKPADTKKLRAEIKAASDKVKAVRKLVQTKQKDTTKYAQPNLSNLQNLLNQRLHDQIRANMGTGSSKNVLNYRSGRFAESARVERLSLSREGMISIFLTYMKYPYATFSQGGRQEHPKSRDPKLLISRSVKEIAQQQVTNRLRAIVV